MAQLGRNLRKKKFAAGFSSTELEQLAERRMWSEALRRLFDKSELLLEILFHTIVAIQFPFQWLSAFLIETHLTFFI
jgi:hypothetical protein